MKRWTYLLCLLLLQACGSIPQRPTRTTAADSPTTIFVARRGWHIDIGFSTSDLEVQLQSVAGSLPDSRFIFFGFGDKHYLVAKHKNFPGLLGALWPSPGVMLTTGLAAAPEEAFGNEHVVRLRVTVAQARSAQAFVWNSLLRQDGVLAFYGMGPYPESVFIGAVPKYSAAYTCNTWAAQVLRAGGLPIHSVGVIFAAQLWSQVRQIHAAARLAPTLR
jgi:hypothetical protein